MLERLDFGDDTQYDVVEAALHLNRYFITKELCKGKKILDVACGEGYGSYCMSLWGAEKVYAIDISQTAIDKAKKYFSHDKIDFMCNEAEKLEMLEDNSIDLVVSFETIEHVNNDKKFLQEIRRVVKKDGMVIISCPNDWWYFPLEEQKNPYHKRKYHLDEFINITESILDKADEILLGNRVEGFANLSVEKDLKRNQNKNNIGLKQILNSTFASAGIIPLSHDLDVSTANYFILVWDYGKNNIKNFDTITVYPSIQAMEMQLREMLKDSETNRINIQKDYDKLINETTELFNKKKIEYDTRLSDYDEKIAELKSQNEFYENEYKKFKFNFLSANEQFQKERIRRIELENILSVEKIEKENILNCSKQYQEERESFKLILDEIYASKSWRIIRKYYNLCDRIKSRCKK